VPPPTLPEKTVPRPPDGARFVLLLLLLLFYCAPPILVLAWSMYTIGSVPSHKIDTDSILLPIVSELGTRSGIYTNTIHQMILPVVAAITAASPNKDLTIGRGVWIFILPLLTIFSCIVDALLFNIRSTLVEPNINAVSQYFIGNASNLSVYVMLLVGIQARQST